MFGLWFSLLGLAIGFLCSRIAKQKERSHKDWFTLGFVFSFIALLIITILPHSEKAEAEIKSPDLFDEDYRFSANV